jgi:RecA/RadA recombinase
LKIHKENKMETPTTEEIAQHYSAMMDSVNLINDGKPEGMDETEWTDCLSRNKEHLEIMLTRDFWTTEDMAPVNAAIAL